MKKLIVATLLLGSGTLLSAQKLQKYRHTINRQKAKCTIKAG